MGAIETEIVNIPGKKATAEYVAKVDQTKKVKQTLFAVKQQCLKQGRDRFFIDGEIVEVDFDIEVNNRRIRMVYRYDPLNDSMIPVQ